MEQAFWFRLRYFFFSVVIDSAREKEGGREQKRSCSHVRQKMSFDIDDDCTECQKEPLDREVT